MLTKTAYLAHTHCSRHLWLAEHRRDLAKSPDPAVQRRLRAGQEVDKLARERFPNGRLIHYRPRLEEMAELTAQAIAEGAETLFQATFAVDDLLVKVDILTRTGDSWHLIEVKSSTSYKRDEHLPDVLFQLYVVQRAGLDVTQASLMHLNNECRYPDLGNLFSLTEITDEVRAYLPQVDGDAAVMRQIVDQETMPDVNIGRHCSKPYQCPFTDYCWQGVDGWTIYHVPYLKRPVEQQLEADGIRYVKDIPADFALGDKRAAAFVDTIARKRIEIGRKAIQAKLDELIYPLYFLDFETIDYAIPQFDGCKPYQQLPFQYSCHVLEADGTLTHCDYLHPTSSDPRQELVEALLGHVGESGQLIAYNIPFERGVLNHLAGQFPQYAGSLIQMADRLWDLLPIFRRHYQHFQFGNSNSLKSVLSVVVPELSYDELEVQDGTQAQMVWEEMIRCEETAVKNQMIEQLKAYCHLDTLAMVEIYRKLMALGE